MNRACVTSCVLIPLLLCAVPRMTSAQASTAKPAASQAKPAATAVPTDRAAIDRLFRGAVRPGEPGVAVIVTRKGQALYRAAYGMANLELGVALKPDHVFRIGSVTKQFTSAAIMMLAEEGKLAVGDPITKFLPDYPDAGQDDHGRTPADPHLGHPELYGHAEVARHVAPGHDGDGACRPVQERADAVRAGRAVALQQLRVHPARGHHRESEREEVRRLRAGADLHAPWHGQHAVRRHRAGDRQARRRLREDRRSHRQRPVPQHDAAVRRRVAHEHRR